MSRHSSFKSSNTWSITFWHPRPFNLYAKVHVSFAYMDNKCNNDSYRVSSNRKFIVTRPTNLQFGAWGQSVSQISDLRKRIWILEPMSTCIKLAINARRSAWKIQLPRTTNRHLLSSSCNCHHQESVSHKYHGTFSQFGGYWPLKTRHKEKI
jgi:hypothetical protein